MGNARDRRSAQKPVASEQRKGQRRKGTTVVGAPVRRDQDWDDIDQELKK
ncbi:MAG TPA: hypothetical protein VLG38_01125 [Gammaproteobacteria bacterium]|nr:hypothetical protein [Gammaproteobacteria bacterium]